MPLHPGAALVRGVGPIPCRVMLVGEAPGPEENWKRRPFVGKAGEVLSLFLDWFGIKRRDVYITNLVKHWTGKGNPDPDEQDILRDEGLLLRELETVRPRTVLCLGRISAQWFLGRPVDMKKMHGIPHRSRFKGIVVIPIYHPASGLHDSGFAALTWLGMRAACQYIRKPTGGRGLPLKPQTRITTLRPTKPLVVMRDAAVDTEGVPGNYYSVQYCVREGEAVVVPAEFAKHLEFRGRLFFNHAKHDVPALDEMGVKFSHDPRDWEDNLIRAYVRQDMPQGLKEQSYRLHNRDMQSFEDLLRPHYNKVAIEYLEDVKALKAAWTPPVETLIEDEATGDLKLKRPQATHVRAGTILRGYLKKPEEFDIREGWLKVRPEQRAEVEALLGPFPPWHISLVPEAEAHRYGGIDAESTFLVARDYKVLPELLQTYRTDVEIIPSLIEMEQNGMPFSLGAAARAHALLDAEARRLRERLRQLSRAPKLNPGSVPQVSHVLFTRWGVKSPRKTKTKGADSSDDRALSALKLQYGKRKDKKSRRVHRFISALIEYRECKKLDGTYAHPEALPRWVKAGRIHPTVKATRTATGRLASENPNLQNIAKLGRGVLIRKCFRTRKGWTLLSVDLSQIELRILAHESRDPVLLRALRRGDDLHRATERDVLHVEDAKAGALRTPAKTLNFAIVYGISGKTLEEQLALNGVFMNGQELIDAWFDRYRGAYVYLDRKASEARRTGFVSTSGGRRRYLPFARLSAVRRAQAEAERQAGNHGIQGGAQEVVKPAQIRWDREYRKRANRIAPTRLLMQIHDELLFETKLSTPRALREVARLLVEMMTRDSGRYRVPILAEAKVGRTWATQEKLALGH